MLLANHTFFFFNHPVMVYLTNTIFKFVDLHSGVQTFFTVEKISSCKTWLTQKLNLSYLILIKNHCSLLIVCVYINATSFSKFRVIASYQIHSCVNVSVVSVQSGPGSMHMIIKTSFILRRCRKKGILISIFFPYKSSSGMLKTTLQKLLFLTNLKFTTCALQCTGRVH